jgi:putative Holliday junction resolvase
MEISHFNNPVLSQYAGKTILAVDYGQKFCGLSTFNIGKDPYPLGCGRIQNKNQNYLLGELKYIIQLEDVAMLVVGIPHLLDGQKTTNSERMLHFAKICQEHFKLPIYLQDETLSTFEAKERMLNDPKYNFEIQMTKIDELSACIILEDFLQNKQPTLI